MISVFLVFGIIGLIWYLVTLGWQGLLVGTISFITVGFILENL